MRGTRVLVGVEALEQLSNFAQQAAGRPCTPRNSGCPARSRSWERIGNQIADETLALLSGAEQLHQIIPIAGSTRSAVMPLLFM